MEKDGWVKAPIWDEWLALTRLQWSGRIAFEVEAARWASPYLHGVDAVSVKISDGGGHYETSLENHLKALEDQRLFLSLILTRSYSLLESHAKLAEFIIRTERWGMLEEGVSGDDQDEIDSIELQGGIEVWSQKLMDRVGQDWGAVFKGKAGLIEVSIVRNALIHGCSRASSRLVENAVRRGCSLPFSAGDEVVVDFPLVHEYRGRIKSFCRIIGDGIIHLSKGSHRILSPA